MSVWSGTPFPIDLVKSDSMSPTLMEGDIVAWTPTKIEDIKVNDVIVFKSEVHWPDEKILVHRVTNILQNKQGQKLLETKGDNNKYIDQAGPHIPEPYIREENLMGKVLSLGQQPLKIPFVGYIGIMINQGFTSISQSTSSKEPSSFIGIFAPLTISILVLLVLIIVLPEKSKTFKEKIKFNIFGRSSLNLKRTITIFLITYMVFFSIIQSHMIIFSKYETMLEFWAVSLGALEIYILIFTILLIPLTFISWAIINLIRNLKEQKDPLLCLEGRCDL